MVCRAIPYEGSEPYVFVSYCHGDKAKIYPLLEQMTKDSYRVWYDDGNHPGDDWMDNIENHMEGCGAVVAFISANSSLSHNCKNEIIFAMKCEKKIIPVLIEETDLPKGLRMQLAHLHYLKSIDYSSEKALLNKVYETEEVKACKSPEAIALKEIADQKPEPTAEEKPADKKIKVIKLVSRKKVKPVSEKKSDSKAEAESEKKPESVVEEKAEKKPESVTEEKSEKKTEPVAEKKPEPEPEKKADEETLMEDGEETVHPSRQPIDDEATVYGSKGAATILGDDDATVRGSAYSFALLLHPMGQRAYRLVRPQTKIGRSPIKCDIAIEGNGSISKCHAEIIQYNQKYFLRDTNSANGTYLKGERLESGKQVELANPAIFQLNDESLILVSGIQARKMNGQKTAVLLMNEEGTAVRVMDSEELVLNRNHKWPDGTLSDAKIHRAEHAKLKKEEDGIYLVDESPELGNGTYLNESRLKHGESRLLTSGDRIRLGDTTLSFAAIII